MQTNSARLAVVIVTFNRCDDLALLLQKLSGLQDEFEHLVVINNASTDATTEVLADAHELFGEKMLVKHMESNLGGAGGFCEGAKIAMTLPVDWFWFSDDDAMPEPGALRHLLDKAESEDDVYGSVAIVKGSEEEELCWPAPTINRGSGRSTSLASTREQMQPVEEVDMLPFLGLMVSKKRVQEVGLPNKSYFISGDDVEYCIRMKAAGARIFQVRDSVIVHPSIPRYIVSLPGWQMYCLRMPPWRRYYDSRNRIWNSRLQRGHRGTVATTCAVLGRMIVTLIYENEPLGQIKAYFRGLRDGIFGYEKSGNATGILKQRT